MLKVSINVLLSRLILSLLNSSDVKEKELSLRTLLKFTVDENLSFLFTSISFNSPSILLSLFYSILVLSKSCFDVVFAHSFTTTSSVLKSFV